MNSRRRNLAKQQRRERKMRFELLADPMVNKEKFLRRMAQFEALQQHIAVRQSR